jgi:hypothetical protein
MMTTYRKIKDKLKSSGSGTGCKWPYFGVIDEQYDLKAAVQPRPDLIGGSLEEEKHEKHVEKKRRSRKKDEDEKHYDFFLRKTKMSRDRESKLLLNYTGKN